MKRSLAPSRRFSSQHEACVVPVAISACASGGPLKEYLSSKQKHEQFISVVISRPFKIPFSDGVALGLDSTRSLGLRRSVCPVPLHDPFAVDALVLHEPESVLGAGVDCSRPNVHVVVDPLLAQHLRPHQREGVRFMYDCVTGKRIPGSFGCIMADEMGLGKTLQCIALLWTLLRQSPEGVPTTAKAIIVAPSSLVKNWAKEISKWLKDRLGVLAIESGSKTEVESKLLSFLAQRHRSISQPVLIISYETFRAHSKYLEAGNSDAASIDLLICDEGHRLKNLENQTYAALSSLKTRRRVLLSGTPIQNDLLEYFSLVHFVNNDILGSVSEFRKGYETPILRGRESCASEEQRKVGSAKLSELITIVNRCMIRRTQLLLAKYLPQKSVYVVCCRLTPCQVQCYEAILSKIGVLLDSVHSNKPTVLTSITVIRSLCNHPVILKENTGGNVAEAIKYIPKTFDVCHSGKMRVLDRLMAIIKATTSDKVVLISNFTQTLSLFEHLCKLRSYTYVRLDGSLSVQKRSKLVDAFNSPESNIFLFMLSSKAGGCGLNLIGANRLIMFDPDWNPANDDQAMARVWRDGQRKACVIYRLVSTGTIEEKILQRQAHKKALSSCVVDDDGDVEGHFSTDQLRDLFQLRQDTVSDTHDVLRCRRCVNNIQIHLPSFDGDSVSGAVEPTDLSKWCHCFDRKRVDDMVLKQTWSNDYISFAFAFSTCLGVYG